jgi:ABC-type bacteriocin/lantibiotic exporter with double-glycine peptidase domain
LAGYAIPFDTDELTQQCKVDASGASIDDIEAAANAYGLVAEQRLFPMTDLCMRDGVPLPAIIVTVRAGSAKEFVNVWRRRGSTLQIMDPWSGVSWVECTELQPHVYVHEMDVAGVRHRGLLAVVILRRAGSPEP